MSTEPIATGTPDPVVGESAPNTGALDAGATEGMDDGTAQATPATDEITSLREENARLKAARDQDLGEKGALAQTRQEMQALREQMAQNATSGADQARVKQLYDEGWNSLMQRANAGEAEAIAIVGALQMTSNENRQLRQALDAYSLPETIRDKAQELRAELARKGENISFATAKRLIEADDLSKRAKAVDDAEKRAAESAASRARGVTSTRTVGSGATNPQNGQRQEVTTSAEWATKYQAADDATQQRMFDDKRAGKIVVRD